MIKELFTNNLSAIDLQGLTNYETQTTILQQNQFLVPLIIFIILSIFFFLFFGIVVKVKKNKLLIQQGNYWLMFLLIIFQIGFLIVYVAFPFYQMWIS